MTIISNPAFPVGGQLIDPAWGSSVASAVIRRYISTAHRDSDLAANDEIPQNGQVIAIAPPGVAPYLMMYNGATSAWVNVVPPPYVPPPSVDMNTDYAINGISMETCTIMDSAGSITTAKTVLYVFAVIPHATSTTTAYIVPTNNGTGTGAKMFVTDAIPAIGVAPHILYTATTDFDNAMDGAVNTAQSIPFPLSGLTVGKKIWICCWLPTGYTKNPVLNGYAAGAATLSQLNLNSGPYRSVTIPATTDPTTSWPNGAATPASPFWIGFI